MIACCRQSAGSPGCGARSPTPIRGRGARVRVARRPRAGWHQWPGRPWMGPGGCQCGRGISPASRRSSSPAPRARCPATPPGSGSLPIGRPARLRASGSPRIWPATSHVLLLGRVTQAHATVVGNVLLSGCKAFAALGVKRYRRRAFDNATVPVVTVLRQGLFAHGDRSADSHVRSARDADVYPIRQCLAHHGDRSAWMTAVT